MILQDVLARCKLIIGLEKSYYMLESFAGGVAWRSEKWKKKERRDRINKMLSLGHWLCIYEILYDLLLQLVFLKMPWVGFR